MEPLREELYLDFHQKSWWFRTFDRRKTPSRVLPRDSNLFMEIPSSQHVQSTCWPLRFFLFLVLLSTTLRFVQWIYVDWGIIFIVDLYLNLG